MTALATRLDAYARLVRLKRPVGWLLLLWPTLWALWLAAEQAPSWPDIALFVGGVFLMRCMGCCVNDIADRKLDAQVERTRGRPLPAGDVSVAEAVALAAFLLALCIGLWLLLAWPARWWALAALAIAVTYPLAKRVFHLPQAHLGVAFSMGIPVAFAHLQGAVPAHAWTLVAANFFWVLAYDTIYAMVDRDDDIKAGNKSSAVWLGERDILAIALAYFCMLTLLLAHGVAVGAGIGFYLACGLGYAMASRLCRMASTRLAHDCTRSFEQNHWLGMLVWLGFVSDTLAR